MDLANDDEKYPESSNDNGFGTAKSESEDSDDDRWDENIFENMECTQVFVDNGQENQLPEFFDTKMVKKHSKKSNKC